jgi:hypothetical protein
MTHIPNLFQLIGAALVTCLVVSAQVNDADDDNQVCDTFVDRCVNVNVNGADDDTIAAISADVYASLAPTADIDAVTGSAAQTQAALGAIAEQITANSECFFSSTTSLTPFQTWASLVRVFAAGYVTSTPPLTAFTYRYYEASYVDCSDRTVQGCARDGTCYVDTIRCEATCTPLPCPLLVHQTTCITYGRDRCSWAVDTVSGAGLCMPVLPGNIALACSLLYAANPLMATAHDACLCGQAESPCLVETPGCVQYSGTDECDVTEGCTSIAFTVAEMTGAPGNNEEVGEQDVPGDAFVYAEMFSAPEEAIASLTDAQVSLANEFRPVFEHAFTNTLFNTPGSAICVPSNAHLLCTATQTYIRQVNQGTPLYTKLATMLATSCVTLSVPVQGASKTVSAPVPMRGRGACGDTAIIGEEACIAFQECRWEKNTEQCVENDFQCNRVDVTQKEALISYTPIIVSFSSVTAGVLAFLSAYLYLTRGHQAEHLS